MKFQRVIARVPRSASVAAFFDVDGTLTRTTILHPLVWYQRARLSRLRYRLWFARLALDVPRYIWIDRRSRLTPAQIDEVYRSLVLPTIRAVLA